MKKFAVRPALPSVVFDTLWVFVLLVSGFRTPHGTERNAGPARFKTFNRAEKGTNKES